MVPRTAACSALGSAGNGGTPNRVTSTPRNKLPGSWSALSHRVAGVHLSGERENAWRRRRDHRRACQHSRHRHRTLPTWLVPLDWGQMQDPLGSMREQLGVRREWTARLGMARVSTGGTGAGDMTRNCNSYQLW
jgi:hypothetical protein